MSTRWRLDLEPLEQGDAGALRRLVTLLKRRDPHQNWFARFVADLMVPVISGFADRLEAGELRGRP